MTTLTIEIPRTPDPRLNPNESRHELRKYPDGETKASLRKLLRQTAKLATQSRLNQSPWKAPGGELHLQLAIYWPRTYHRQPIPDDDNAIASCKALIDGVAEALHIDDKRLRFRGLYQDVDQNGQGYVLVTIRPAS